MSEELQEDARRTASLKIQDEIPIRTIGIENQRERDNYSDLPPQNYIHVWFARRPTPASRAAILSSVLPESVDNDELLKWMCIDPDNLASDSSISSHVQEKWRTRQDRSGLLYDHMGYRKSYKNTPTGESREQLHDLMREMWGGELPTVLDATAGGGAIPFESMRYGLPTIANELNPVPSTILKSVLQHPRVDGDLSGDIRKWGERILSLSKDELKEYYPNSKQGRIPVHYLWTHTISCPDCGSDVPLSPNWWIDKVSGRKEGVAARPFINDDGDVSFEVVTLPEDVSSDEFNPTSGTVSYGKAECLKCNVTIEQDEVRQSARDENLKEVIYAVEYRDDHTGDRGNFRSPNDDDYEIINKIREKLSSDPELFSFLREEVPVGLNTNQARRYGLTEWRDMFAPRQIFAHHTFLDKFSQCKEEIYEEYDEPVAEVIMTYLTFAADKLLDYNSRMCAWAPSDAKIGHSFERADYAFKWSFAEGNPLVEELGYTWALDSMVEVYEELRELSGHSDAEVSVLQDDSASLSLNNNSVDAVIFDPPYYDSMMYAEMADFFYVWMKKYLGDVYPSFFTDKLTEKKEEAVANPERFEGLAGDDESKAQMAKEDYEGKMSDIFSDLHRVLTDDGILTMMFTHKSTEAWDTLTKSLIKSGFVITATHPISTESSYRIRSSGKNTADSTILLTGEKRSTEQNESTLWGDVKHETRKVARKKAEQLDTQNAEFSKVDMILASFGPTLRVFTTRYPVVDDKGKEVTPQTALDEARSAVRDYFIDKYLNDGVRQVDPKTEWYLLSWFIFEAQRFPYDEGRRLAVGIGEDVDSLKKTNRMWRKRSGDILLRPHGDRVQDVNKDPDNRSGRKPVDPDALSFSTALDKVHAAMHVYNAQGATEAWNWLNDRNCGSDPAFKATLESLLRVLPHDQEDWEIARNLAAGDTGDLLDLDLNADVFRRDDDDDEARQGSLKEF